MEESDEISSEFDFQREVLGQIEDYEDVVLSDDIDESKDITEDNHEQTLLSVNSKEMPKYTSIVENWSLQSRRTLVKRLLEQIIVNRNESDEFEMFRNLLPEPEPEPTILSNLKTEDVEDSAAEDLSDGEDGTIDHFLNNGRFNQKNQGKNKADKSNEETRSSWSSSEEALATCDGALFNIPLDGSPSCHENATFDDMKPIMNNLSYVADSTGYLKAE